MQRQDYCVYNQTNECFLSLGATLGDRPFARLKQRFRIGRRRADEGSWFKPFEPKRALTLFTARDLIFLDSMHRVVHIIESYPGLRVVPPYQEAVSLLALPVHTISSSQTRLGNQLLVCAPTEMERKLRKLFEPGRNSDQPQPSPRPTPHPVQSILSKREEPHALRAFDKKQGIGVPIITVPAHRGTQSAPALPDSRANGELALHAIRDLSATGLYLVTRDRWPIGAEINMNLQPGGGAVDTSVAPISVRMRVTRWGTDGVSLEFATAAAEPGDAQPRYAC